MINGGAVARIEEAARTMIARKALATLDARLAEINTDPAFISRPADPWTVALALALADVKSALGNDTAKVRAPLFDDDGVELLTCEYPKPSWRVTGLLTDGGQSIVGGEPKAATKTWIATEIAIAIATGTKVCGEFYAERGRVCYFYAEDQKRQVRNRVRALLAGAGRTLQPGRFMPRPRGMFIDVTRDEDLAWIVASVRRIGAIDLLVLDPLRDVSSAAEDKSDEMGPVMRRLRLLGELLGCTVLVVHHTGKASIDTAKRRPGQRLRGSGAIHGSTDSGIYLSDSESDGATVFRNSVDSEVKGARSAGRFGVELTIEDDDLGEAVKATWAVTREASKASKKQTAGNADDATIFAFVRELAMRGEHLSRRALRDHDECPIAEKRTRDALDRLISAGQLRLVGVDVRLPEPSQRDSR